MKYIKILLFIMICSFLNLAAPGYTQEFVLSWERDLPIMGVSVSAFLTGALLPEKENMPDKPAREALPGADRVLLKPYNRTFDKISDLTQYAAFFLPGVLVFLVPSEDPVTLGIMYAEAALFSIGAKNIIKTVLPRHRPYTYFADAQDDPEQFRSFPSGHTTMAFTGSAFLAAALLTLIPESPWTIPLLGTSLSLAAATGFLRVFSGNHFLTDVLTGAVLGIF